MNRFWITSEQRRALRTWALVLSGAALVGLDAWAVWLLTYGFGVVSATHRIVWVGTIAETNVAVLGVVILVYGAEISIRSFSGTRGADGSSSFSMSGVDTGEKLQDAGAALIDAGSAVKTGASE